MTIASPAGGEAPLDPASVEMFKEDAESVAFLRQKNLWENTPKLSSFLGKSDEFDAIFYPGGHGPMYDLAVDPESQRLIAEFYEKGKVVSTVCHGPAAFVNVKLSNGKGLLADKRVTGFTNEEEEQVGLTKVVPFLLEDKLREVSGSYEKAEPWAEKVVVDGKIITGQNPASAKAVGEAIVKALQ